MFFIRLFLANTWNKKKSGITVLVWEKRSIYFAIGLSLRESLTFCTCTCSCARANDAKIVRSRDAQCNTKELPLIGQTQQISSCLWCAKQAKASTRKRKNFDPQCACGRFPFTKKFRKFRLGCKWHTRFWFVPLENFRNQRNFWKGSPVFPLETFRWKCVFHLQLFKGLTTSSLFTATFVNFGA